MNDLLDLQRAALETKPGLFSKRAWQEATLRYTRVVLLQLRGFAREAAAACHGALVDGRCDSEARKLIASNGGADFLDAFVARAFESVESAFESHDWSGTGVTSPEQAVRLLFVGGRVQARIIERVDQEGLTRELFDGARDYVDEQLLIAFNTPAGQARLGGR
jgi:hypothetical protein